MDANDRELKFKITDEDRKRCGLSKQRALYYRYDAYDELVELMTYQVMNMFSEYTDILSGSLNW